MVLPITKLDGPDPLAVLTNDRYLLLLLLANCAYIIWGLIRSIWDSKAKKLDEIQQVVNQLPVLIHKIEQLDHHVKTNVPTRDTVEVMIWKHLREKDQ